ncbi:hypothetical protein LCGC14_1576710 [marine sediment metagenome]|uniref:Uncharacterized protein n=1 Tax=marine sediment metagenome TaxID=412755 RepID=A0A0F9KZ50_9ZZZZ
MKIYSGKRQLFQGGGQVVTVTDEAGVRELDKAASLAVVNHSPDGFSWGYSGSGAAQTALAILLDALSPLWTPLAVRLHQPFKFEYVSGWGDSWEMSGDEVLGWVRKQIDRGVAEIR